MIGKKSSLIESYQIFANCVPYDFQKCPHGNPFLNNVKDMGV